MSRYIDINAIPNIYTATHQELVLALEDAPTIDIVRCKECRYWKWIEWAKEYRCTLRNTAFNARADDFCSYGERKGADDE